MYGFKPLTNINDEVIEQIYRNRPYVSIKDFMNKLLRSEVFDHFLL